MSLNRLKKAQQLLKENKLSALIIDNPIDLFYLTGQKLSLGRLVIEKNQATLFVDGRYFEGCSKVNFLVVALTAGYGKESAFFNWWKFAQEKIGFDAEYTTYADFEEMKQLSCELSPLNGPIKRLREIKEEAEIAKLKKAAELGSSGFDYLCTLLKEGITEKQLALELEIFWLKAGAEKLAFSPHIAFGSETSKPHYQVSNRPLKKGDIIMFDIGVVLEHYHSDMTRVIAFGQPDLQLQKIYQLVFEAHRAAIKLCKPGALIKDVDHAARDLIDQAGFKEHFPHGLGHGVGLEIHESPRIRDKGPDAMRPMQEGMCITIEPGIYLPGVGGVRLEDTLIVTKEGYENLTNRPLASNLPIF